MVQPVSSPFVSPLAPARLKISRTKNQKKSEYKSETTIHARSQPPPTSPRLPARPTTRRRLDYPSSPAAFLLDKVWLAAIAVFLVDGELPCPRRPRPSLPGCLPILHGRSTSSPSLLPVGVLVRRCPSGARAQCLTHAAAPVRHSLSGHHISGATSSPRLPRRAVGGEVHAPIPLK